MSIYQNCVGQFRQYAEDMDNDFYIEALLQYLRYLAKTFSNIFFMN